MAETRSIYSLTISRLLIGKTPSSFYGWLVKKIILDENLPHPLRHCFPDQQVVTVFHQGWSGIQNGELLKLIDGEFDILVTADKKLRYQQNLKNRKIGIIELPSTRMSAIEALMPKIQAAVKAIQVGEYIEIT